MGRHSPRPQDRFGPAEPFAASARAVAPQAAASGRHSDFPPPLSALLPSTCGGQSAASCDLGSSCAPPLFPLLLTTTMGSLARDLPEMSAVPPGGRSRTWPRQAHENPGGGGLGRRRSPARRATSCFAAAVGVCVVWHTPQRGKVCEGAPPIRRHTGCCAPTPRAGDAPAPAAGRPASHAWLRAPRRGARAAGCGAEVASRCGGAAGARQLRNARRGSRRPWRARRRRTRSARSRRPRSSRLPEGLSE